MRHDDGRKLDHKTLEAIRVRAVQRVIVGESPEVVIKALGMSRARIYEWLAAYREGGFDALKAKQISGRPRKLSGAQIRELARRPRGLRIQYGRAGRGGAALSLAPLFSQTIMHRLKLARLAPPAEGLIHVIPVRKLLGKHTPGAARSNDITAGIDNRSATVSGRQALAARLLEQIRHQFPFDIRQAARIKLLGGLAAASLSVAVTLRLRSFGGLDQGVLALHARLAQ